MKSIKILTIMVLALWFFAGPVQPASAEPVGTAFTYQGRLLDAYEPADGLYDLQFKLYDANVGGSKMGNDVNLADVYVIDGYFTVQLDFYSDVFNGNTRWLDIGVRPGELEDPNMYTPLNPRQKITPTPYALQTRGIFVDSAGNVGIGTVNPEQKLHVAGSVKIVDGSQGANKVLTSDSNGAASWQNLQVLQGGVPSGVIVMWWGPIANIPAGWALCDGANSTPDLRDRFIVGAGSTYAVAATGGEAMHTLTIAEMPPHTHSYRYWPGWNFSGDSEYGAKGNPDDSHQTGSTGGGQPHNNLPPYYALAYIMKL